MKRTERLKHTNSLNNENTSLTPGAACAAAGKIIGMIQLCEFNQRQLRIHCAVNKRKAYIHVKSDGTAFFSPFPRSAYKLAFIVKPKKK